MKLDDLWQYGVDVKDGLMRCLDDHELYETALGMFRQDDVFARAKAAYDSRNNAELFKCLHEMKGVCGNVGLKALYDEVCPLVEHLRHGDGLQPEVDERFAKIEAAYHRAMEGLEAAE